MVNDIVRINFIFLTLFLFGCAAPGCTGKATKPVNHSMNFPDSDKPAQLERLWEKKIQGRITDLAVAGSGEAIAIAAAPEPELDARKYTLGLYDKSGHQAWNIILDSPVKSLTITDDGSLIFISNHNEELVGIDSKGKKLWSTRAACKPIVLNIARKILCYHDDDPKPQYGFEIIDWNGAKSFSYKIKDDVLALKVSRDDKYIALGMNHGELVLLGDGFNPAWSVKLDGELIDVSVSSGPLPKVAALSVSPKGQKISIFDTKGQLLGEKPMDIHSEQLELLPNGTGLFVYGNGPKGQHLTLLEVPAEMPKTPQPLLQKWRRADTRYADYSSNMIVTEDLAIIGFEDILSTTRHSHLLAFDLDSKLKWNVPLITEEGAYLYAQGYSSRASLIVVGTDDSILSAYSVSK